MDIRNIKTKSYKEEVEFLKGQQEKLMGVKNKIVNELEHQAKLLETCLGNEKGGLSEASKELSTVNNNIKELQAQKDIITFTLKFSVENLAVVYWKKRIQPAVDIINKYKGKQLGPKTREKLKKEIKDSTGLYLYISEYSVYLMTGNEYLAEGTSNVYDYTKYNISHKGDMLYDSKVVGVDIDRANNTHLVYTEDIEKTVREKLHTMGKLKAAYEQFHNATEEYGEELPHTATRFNQYFILSPDVLKCE